MRRTAAVVAAGLLAAGCSGSTAPTAQSGPLPVRSRPPSGRPSAPPTVAPVAALRAAQRRTVAAGTAVFNLDVRAVGATSARGVDDRTLLRRAGAVDFARDRYHADVYPDVAGQPQSSAGRTVVTAGTTWVATAASAGGWSARPSTAREAAAELVGVLDGALGPVRDSGRLRLPTSGTPTQVYRMWVDAARVLPGVPEVAGRRGVQRVWVDGAGRIVRVDLWVDLGGAVLPGRRVGAEALIAVMRLSGFGVDVYQKVPKR